MSESDTNEEYRFSLENRVVVITGCTGVLGTAYCRAIAQRGGRLVMADFAERDPVSEAQALAKETGAQVLGVICDVGSEQDVIALFETAIQHRALIASH